MPRKILALVVDDFPDGRELVAEYLTFKGFAVLTAATAAEAIDRAAREAQDHTNALLRRHISFSRPRKRVV